MTFWERNGEVLTGCMMVAVPLLVVAFFIGTDIHSRVTAVPPVYKYYVGDVVESVASGQRGVIINRGYMHTERPTRAYYTVRFGATHISSTMDGGFLHGARSSETVVAPLCVLYNIHEFEIRLVKE